MNYRQGNNFHSKNREPEVGDVNITFNENSYVDEAEEVIQVLKNANLIGIGSNQISTSNIRNILAMTSEIYDLVRISGVDAVVQKLLYLRIQLVYASGRNLAVKIFIEKAQLLDILEMINDQEDKKEKRVEIIRLCRYMEALVAYFKFYGEEK